MGPVADRAGPVLAAPEWLAEARAGADLAFGHLFSACDDVRDFGLAVLRPWPGRSLRGGIDRPLTLLTARATTTYWALIELLRMGFGDAATMLTRSLFEDMVDLHWITVEPETALERLAKHGEHSDMRLTDALRRDPFLLRGESLADYDPDRRQELDKLFGPHGTRGWTGRSLHDRVGAIEHLWDHPDERRTLQFSRRVVHLDNNETLHVSGRGLARLVRDDTEGRLQLRLGPAPERVATAAFAAFWNYSQCLRLVMRHFGFPADDQHRFVALYAARFAAFHEYP